jgi:hypothetical protein
MASDDATPSVLNLIRYPPVTGPVAGLAINPFCPHSSADGGQGSSPGCLAPVATDFLSRRQH